MLLPVLVCAAAAGLGGLLVPRLIAVVPEPEPDPEDELAAERDGVRTASIAAQDKELYADVARSAYLGPVSALVGAALGAAVGATLGWAWPLVYLLPMIPLGTALAVIDWRTHRLPTWYLAPAYPVLVLLILACGLLTRDWDDLLRALLGWAVLGGFYVLGYLASTSFGYGDVRLAGLLGMALGYLGWPELVVGGFFALPLFTLLAAGIAVRRGGWRAIRKQRIPFGPTMLVAAALGVSAGEPIARWYLHRSGMG